MLYSCTHSHFKHNVTKDSKVEPQVFKLFTALPVYLYKKYKIICMLYRITFKQKDIRVYWVFDGSVADFSFSLVSVSSECKT